MKVGFHTLPWCIKLDDAKRTLDIIAESGYQGVEFSQRPDALGVDDVEVLLELLQERNLALLCITGGTSKERIEFFRNHRPEYFRIRHWDRDRIPTIIRQGFVPALHPGMFTPMQRPEDIFSLLEEYPELRIIYDTAHQTIAGENLAESIQLIRGKLAVVHLKDWTPEFGRSGPRYERGFTDLGNGVVDLDSVLHELERQDYNGWVVAEIERAYCNDPGSAVRSSAEWMARKGLLAGSPEVSSKSTVRSDWPFPRRSGRCSPEREARFRETLMLAAAGKSETFYQSVANAFAALIPCDVVTLWTFSPSQDQMGLIACFPPTSWDMSRRNAMKASEVLTGIAVERQAAVTHFDLTEKQPGRRYGFPNRKSEHSDLQEMLKLEHMLTVPVYNSGNQNYIRLLVNLFPSDDELTVTDEELYWFGKAVVIAADMMLDRLCSSAAAKVNLLASQSEQTDEFLSRLIALIQERLNCSGTAIFLVNEARDKLELAATTGTEWSVPENERFYRRGEGLTGKVWARKQPLITIDSFGVPGHVGKSAEVVQNKVLHACLWVPFVDSNGKVIGVVRCRNKRTSSVPAPDMFTDDDAAVLDAIGQAAVPHLHILLDKEWRAKAMGRLTHELKVPLVAIRGAADFMMRTKGVNKLFDYDYPSDIWSWSELMRRLLGNADLFRYSPGEFPILATPTLVMAEVVAPAVRQVRVLLEERDFSVRRIEYGRFEQVPRLWIDRNQFQQVIFNLLSNAIKHCYKDPNSFQVEISGGRSREGFVIWFRDWGPGIRRDMRDMIFEEGFRTPEAASRNVTGQGLGLWVVRQVIEAHGGKIELTNLNQPTEFTIYLPRPLAKPPLQRESH